MSLVQDYFQLCKQYMQQCGPQTVVLMQNGAFFEVYGLKDASTDAICTDRSTIVAFSTMCDLNMVDKKLPGEKHMMLDGYKVINAGFKTHLVDRYVDKLQEQGYTVVVYEETGEDPITKKKIRTHSCTYSPGTYFSEDPTQTSNYVTCLWLDLRRHKTKATLFVGVGILDIVTGQTFINEHHVDYQRNPSTFDEIERLLSIYPPNELTVVTNVSWTDICPFLGITCTAVHVVDLAEESNELVRNCEKQRYQAELLGRFYDITDFNVFFSVFYENAYAAQAFCWLLHFVYERNAHLMHRLAEPLLENASDRMQLANHSLRQLHLLHETGSAHTRHKYASIERMLNQCVTPMGRRAFTQMLFHPTTVETYLQVEYDMMDAFMRPASPTDAVFPLQSVKDMEKLIRQISLHKISPKQVYQLYTSLQTAAALWNQIQTNSHESFSLLRDYLTQRLAPNCPTAESLQEPISFIETKLRMTQCMGLDMLSKDNHECSIIQHGVDAALDEQRSTLMQAQDQLQACQLFLHHLLASKLSKKNEDTTTYFIKQHETEMKHISLVATEKRCQLLEEAVKSLSCKEVTIPYTSSETGLEQSFVLVLSFQYHKQSAANTAITSAQITEWCRTLGRCKTQWIEHVERVYRDVLSQWQQFQVQLRQATQLVTCMDVFYTKVQIAQQYHCCKPELVADSKQSCVQVTQLRHLLIEQLNTQEAYVGNDISLGVETEMDGMLLYGTNAVGKTSLIRALGIAVVMAQAGMFVPATSFRFKPYKHLFTRIVGNDNLFKGLSTFAVEMSELRTILRLANQHSLVLGDELCSGTETVSAVSIFVSGIQTLAKVHCSFLFATHLHEIVCYDEITSLSNVCMKHMQVVYDPARDCLVYNRQLQDGSGSNVYGLEVCKSLHLPSGFIDQAYIIRSKYFPDTQSILQYTSSSYNAKHLVGGLCDRCKRQPAVEVHHMKYQSSANAQGHIVTPESTFHKHAASNLVNLCVDCHDAIHASNTVLKKTKTTKGMMVVVEEKKSSF